MKGSTYFWLAVGSVAYGLMGIQAFRENWEGTWTILFIFLGVCIVLCDVIEGFNEYDMPGIGRKTLTYYILEGVNMFNRWLDKTLK